MAIPAVLFETVAGDPPGAGGAGRAVILHDLACDGFRLEDAPDLPPGAAFAIDLPGAGSQPARVAARDGRFHDCRFAAPLPAALLPVVMAAARKAPAPPPGFAEPHVDKWHPAARIALLLGLAVLLWATVLRGLP